jgi:hypothetical protein
LILIQVFRKLLSPSSLKCLKTPWFVNRSHCTSLKGCKVHLAYAIALMAYLGVEILSFKKNVGAIQ